MTFDLVIIDEASQMLPEDALSAIRRGRQLVVVGDREQLPPTTFFTFGSNNTDGDDDEDEGPPAESILELANSRYKPMRELLWHYRSRHQSLIAFSNKQFYSDRLVVFPAPVGQDPIHGVSSVLVDGLYKAGVKINVPEAQRLIHEAKDFMARHPELSLGVATVNRTSADFIRQEFDNLYERDSVVRGYVDRWEGTLQSFFVKNLENVQGDERDVIFIATVYGPDENGAVHQRFGPINSAAGYRRLNVLFTRAKQHVRVFTSLRPVDIRPTANSHKGVTVLQKYLEYASTGRLDTGTLTGGEPESDFERFVVERLRKAGYQASCQVGVAGYRIDIGVHHPENPNLFILGVECDGATYHSARSARDRDRIRQQILENLGWTIHRIWSTDWFANPDEQFERLEQRIQEIVEATPAPPTVIEAPPEDVGSAEEEDVQGEEPEGVQSVEEESVIPASSRSDLAVRVGDRVTYAPIDELFEGSTVVIGENLGGWTDRVITLDTPVARGLLGARENEVITLNLPREERKVVVQRIDRAGTTSA